MQADHRGSPSTGRGETLYLEPISLSRASRQQESEAGSASPSSLSFRIGLSPVEQVYHFGRVHSATYGLCHRTNRELQDRVLH